MYTVTQFKSQLTEQDKEQISALEKHIDETLASASGEVIYYRLRVPLSDRVRNKLIALYLAGGWRVEYVTEAKGDCPAWCLKFTVPPPSMVCRSED